MGLSTPTQEAMVWVRYFRKNGCFWGESAFLGLGLQQRFPPDSAKGRGGRFSLDALEDGGERWSQNSGLGISAGGGGSSGPQVPNSTTNGPPYYARETWALQSQPSQHWRLKLSPFSLQAPPKPIGSSSRQSAQTPPPQPDCPALIGWERSRDLVLPIWEPLTQPHTQAQVRPPSPFSSPFPSPPPPPGHWQRLTVPGGAHQLVQHRAHLGLRRHGGGVAGGWTGGGGAQTGPFREGGDKGKGWGKVRRSLVAAAAAATSRRAGKEPEDLQRSPGCAPDDHAHAEDRAPRKWPSSPQSLSKSWDRSDKG